MPELTYNDPDDIESSEDVSFPKHAHHFRVRSELSQLSSLGVITDDEADEIYDDWKESRK